MGTTIHGRRCRHAILIERLDAVSRTRALTLQESISLEHAIKREAEERQRRRRARGSSSTSTSAREPSSSELSRREKILTSPAFNCRDTFSDACGTESAGSIG